MENKKGLNKNTIFIFVLGCLIGTLVFIRIYGIKVLDVTYDSWLMAGGDLSQHYMGWRFFRASQWNFPFGLMDGVIYPQKVSVMYMDSIPIFAIIFKLLSPILPTTFQYFGIWGMLSFMLQGGLSILIIRKFTSSYIICIISELFFVFSPIMMQRMFAHTALAGHWIILLTIYIYINESYTSSLKKNILVWSLLACLSVTVHMYFFPMVMIMIVCHLLRDYLKNKNIFRTIIIFVSPIISAFILLFFLGAFYGNSGMSDGGLGVFSANINSLFNPQGYSKYLMNLPTATDGQGEGFSYLGLGIISAIIVVIYLKTEDLFKCKKEEIIGYIKNNSTSVLLIIATIVFFVLALSPTISLNKYILFTIPYPSKLVKILSIFRSSGRFMWPILYIIYIYVIKKIIDKSTKKSAMIFLCICIIIQISDLSNVITQKNDYFSNKIKYISQLQSPVWSNFAQKNYKHIVFFKNMNDNLKLMWSFSEYAINNNMTLNDGYVARKDSKFIDEVKNQYLEELSQGNSKDDTIYVFGNSEGINLSLPDYRLNYYNIDGAIIGVKDSISGVEEYKQELDENLKRGIDILPKSGKNLKNGEDNDAGRMLKLGGVSYGPYADLGEGSYIVTIIGNNLEKADYDIAYDEGKNKIEIQKSEKNNEKIVVKFTVKKELKDFEFRIFNNNQETIIVNSIIISK